MLKRIEVPAESCQGLKVAARGRRLVGAILHWQVPHETIVVIGRSRRQCRTRDTQTWYQRQAHASSDHVLDGLQRGAFKALADALGITRKTREFRADFEDMVTKAMAIAQQQHGLAFERVGGHAF